MRRCTHWLKFRINNNQKAVSMLQEYQSSHDCEMYLYYCDTNMKWHYIRLVCWQSYDGLELDCNSFPSPIYRLERKPSELIKSEMTIEEYFRRNGGNKK